MNYFRPAAIAALLCASACAVDPGSICDDNDNPICATGQHCENGACVQSCVPGFPSNGGWFYPSCKQGTGQLCPTAAGTSLDCTTTCVGTDQYKCPQGYFCSDSNVCIQSCTSDSSCSKGQRCDSNGTCTFFCSPGIDDADQCPTDYACDAPTNPSLSVTDTSQGVCAPTGPCPIASDQPVFDENSDVQVCRATGVSLTIATLAPAFPATVDFANPDAGSTLDGGVTIQIFFTAPPNDEVKLVNYTGGHGQDQDCEPPGRCVFAAVSVTDCDPVPGTDLAGSPIYPNPFNSFATTDGGNTATATADLSRCELGPHTITAALYSTYNESPIRPPFESTPDGIALAKPVVSNALVVNVQRSCSSEDDCNGNLGEVCSSPDGGVCLVSCDLTDGGTAPNPTCPPDHPTCAGLWYPQEDVTACQPSGQGLDTYCDGGTVSCDPGFNLPGGTTVCDNTVCTAPCSQDSDCPADHVCTSETGSGVCVADCSDGGACPTGLLCAAVSPGQPPTRCISEALQGVYCGPYISQGGPALCGPTGLGGSCVDNACTFPCNNDGTCPSGYLCSQEPGDPSGFCYQPCGTATASCPSQTEPSYFLPTEECRSLWYGEQPLACLPNPELYSFPEQNINTIEQLSEDAPCFQTSDCGSPNLVCVLAFNDPNYPIYSTTGVCALTCNTDSQCGQTGRFCAGAGPNQSGVCAAGCDIDPLQSSAQFGDGSLCPGTPIYNPFVCTGPWPYPNHPYLCQPLESLPSACFTNSDCVPSEVCTVGSPPLQPASSATPPGICTFPCPEDGGSCGPGFVCSARPGSPGGQCMVNCASNSCSNNSACGPLFYDVLNDAGTAVPAMACLPLASDPVTNNSGNTANMGLDQPCALDGSQCGPPGSNTICDLGQCEPRCVSDNDCPSGRPKCSASDGVTQGSCLLTGCAGPSDAGCQAGFICEGPYSARTDFTSWCVPSAFASGAASGFPSAGPGAACNSDSQCGPSGLPGSCVDGGVCSFPCGDHSSCPSGFTCSAAPDAGGGLCFPSCAQSAVGNTCTYAVTSVQGYVPLTQCENLWYGLAAQATACLPFTSIDAGAYTNPPPFGMDQPCAPNGPGCGLPGAQTVCELGVCEASCHRDSDCPIGRVCSTTDGGAGSCVVDCTGSPDAGTSDGGAPACPIAFACVGSLAADGGSRCLPNSIAGQVCKSPADCGLIGLPGACVYGACSFPCGAEGSCPSGYACSAAPDAGGGFCFAACPANNVGPFSSCAYEINSQGYAVYNTYCEYLWDGEKTACLPIVPNDAGSTSPFGLDQPCSPSGVSCGLPGSNAVCDLGVCETPCQDGAGCPADRVCSAKVGPGTCMVEGCALDGGSPSCPYSFTCIGPLADQTSRCVPNNVVGAYCNVDSDCGRGGFGGTCDSHSCVFPCGANNSCPSGFSANNYPSASSYLCSAAPDAGGGNCFLACNPSNGCYNSTVGSSLGEPTLCMPLWSGQGYACFGQGSGPDSLCDGGTGSACGAAGSGAVCSDLGACEIPCGKGCTSGYVCSKPPGKADGFCVLDCSNDAGVCSTPNGNNLACLNLWYSDKSGCINDTGGTVPNNSQLEACVSVTAISECTFSPTSAQVGGSFPVNDQTSLSVPCTNGNFCPDNSTCDVGGTTCTCNSGYTQSNNSGAPCGGSVACGSASVAPGATLNYWCKPVAPADAGCDLSNGSKAIWKGTCTCVDGRTFPQSCGDTISCDYHCSDGCDVVKQDCGVGQKCTLGFGYNLAGTNNYLNGAASCAPPSSTPLVADGQPCTQGTDPYYGSPIRGSDNCAPGLFCSGETLATGQVCRKLCEAQTDGGPAVCDSGQRCLWESWNDGALPPVGFCVPAPCTLFGTDCPTGLQCMPFQDVNQTSWFGMCFPSGAVPQGAQCDVPTPPYGQTYDGPPYGGYCVANSYCGVPARSDTGDFSSLCLPLCDSSHPCPGALTCFAEPGMPNSGGFCK